MAAMRHTVDGENDFRRTVEVLSVLQDEEIGAELGHPKFTAIA
jgi:hypothetical protein